MHRSEVAGSEADLPPPFAPSLSLTDVQPAEEGVGPLFHRLYGARIAGPRLAPEELIETLRSDPNIATPKELARFLKVAGGEGQLVPGDEFVVRMPGPWDGPVRVSAVDRQSFRLATLTGHLEAGQIEFRASSDGPTLCFEIESWARSSDRLVNVLYHHLRMAKEVQLHMWTSFLERVADVSGGRLSGGITIVSRKVEDPFAPS